MLHRLLSGSSLACLPFSDCRGNRVDMSPLLSLPEAAKYLTDVGGRLVVLAGTNHVWRDAIPERFERMTASRASAGEGCQMRRCTESYVRQKLLKAGGWGSRMLHP